MLGYSLKDSVSFTATVTNKFELVVRSVFDQ